MTMTVIRSYRDSATLILTFVAEFDVSVERVWQVWADPRQLEQWWGPPTWPATFTRHELAVGGECRYHMTGPEGQRAHGWWTVTAVEAPCHLEFDDGFADDDGQPLASDQPVHAAVTIEAVGETARTRMTTVTTFASAEHLERMVELGMEEGMRLAMGQLDAVLA